ncbi:MAG TPA: hypothetical protein VK327_13820, partial [Candidatus Paceibacterota bacterium]|nr:hypothetical protein [Candidatus Paceibacterota bacterium]
RHPYGSVIRWTAELHRFKGNLLFADAHVEERNGREVLGGGAVGAMGDFVLPTSSPTPASYTSRHSIPASPAPSAYPSTAPAAKPTANDDNSLPVAARESSASSTSLSLHMRPLGIPEGGSTNPVAAAETVSNTAPVAVTAPNQPASAPEDDWFFGAAHDLIRKMAWLLYLLLATLLAVVIALRLRQKARSGRE